MPSGETSALQPVACRLPGAMDGCVVQKVFWQKEHLSAMCSMYRREKFWCLQKVPTGGLVKAALLPQPVLASTSTPAHLALRQLL